jgi:hypothetical protein
MPTPDLDNHTEQLFDVSRIASTEIEDGYFEVLEIKDPPSGMSAFVIHCLRLPHGHRFWEYPSLDGVMVAWKDAHTDVRSLHALGGCNRMTAYSANLPWFLAERSSVFVPGRDFVLDPTLHLASI